jgi:hypothetical protein
VCQYLPARQLAVGGATCWDVDARPGGRPSRARRGTTRRPSGRDCGGGAHVAEVRNAGREVDCQSACCRQVVERPASANNCPGSSDGCDGRFNDPRASIRPASGSRRTCWSASPPETTSIGLCASKNNIHHAGHSPAQMPRVRDQAVGQVSSHSGPARRSPLRQDRIDRRRGERQPLGAGRCSGTSAVVSRHVGHFEPPTATSDTMAHDEFEHVAEVEARPTAHRAAATVDSARASCPTTDVRALSRDAERLLDVEARLLAASRSESIDERACDGPGRAGDEVGRRQ